MKIVGISGNPGSGKTTLADCLFLNFETRVIHLDHILDYVKDILPNQNFVSVERESGEKVKFLKKTSIFSKMKKNKYLLWAYLNSKWELSRLILNHMLSNYYKEDVDYVIIEGFNLETIISLDEIDFSILVEAPLDLRVERVNKRNHCIELNARGNAAFEDIADTSDVSKYDYRFLNTYQGNDFYNQVMNLQSEVFNHHRSRVKGYDFNK